MSKAENIIESINVSHPKQRIFRVAQPGEDGAGIIVELMKSHGIHGDGTIQIGERRFSVRTIGTTDMWIVLAEYDPDEARPCGATFVGTDRRCSICGKKHDGIVPKKTLAQYIAWWRRNMKATQGKE